jgi:site-specific recombinase XerD
MAELLDDLLGAFRRHLAAEGRTERTAVLYGQSVTFFGRWLAEHGREATLEQLTRTALREWLADLLAVNATNTVRTRYRGMNRFCRWLLDEGELAAHPMKGLKMPDKKLSPVPVVSDETAAALFKACAGKRFYDRRDEAVLRMLWDTGMRVSEVCGIALDEVDLTHMTVIVQGKGGKKRAVFWASRTGRTLDRYLRMRARHRHAASRSLFLGERGPLTPDGVRELLSVRCVQAAVEHLHPHQFRHTLAHDFLANGGQWGDLKRIAGWESDEMLKVYGASLADERAAAAFRRMSRGDRV